jgi:uncharacterized membrane protein
MIDGDRTDMDTNALIHWLHLVAIVLWIGGTFYQLAVDLPISTRDAHGFPEARFTESVLRFRWITILAIGFSVFSGIMRVSAMGGMGSVPPLIHTKLLIAMIMMGLSILAGFYLAPKLHLGIATLEDTTEAEKTKLKSLLTQFIAAQGFTVLLGLGILMMLANAGLV